MMKVSEAVKLSEIVLLLDRFAIGGVDLYAQQEDVPLYVLLLVHIVSEQNSVRGVPLQRGYPWSSFQSRINIDWLQGGVIDLLGR